MWKSDHRRIGVHWSRWDQLRSWGPVDSRWDPHPPPPADQPDAAVLYASTEAARLARSCPALTNQQTILALN
jgi:hypothetical protein